MKFLKPKFWDSKISLLVFLLIPISFLFLSIANIKRYLVSKRVFKIPIICIGNIYVGGTGKTPLSIKIANNLKKREKSSAIIKKFYKDQADEHIMIKNNAVELITDSKRERAVEKAEKKNLDVVILDDGFQNHSIKKNLNIVCFNSNQLIGNGYILPAGPLRESLRSLIRANIIVINGDKKDAFEKKILNISKSLKIFYSHYLPTNINEFRNKKLLAFAGIGNPDNFFQLLLRYKLDIRKKIYFPDHYEYSEKDLEKINIESTKNNYTVITTEKDFHRIKKSGLNNLNYLKLEVIIEEEEKFMKEILKYL